MTTPPLPERAVVGRTTCGHASAAGSTDQVQLGAGSSVYRHPFEQAETFRKMLRERT